MLWEGVRPSSVGGGDLVDQLTPSTNHIFVSWLHRQPLNESSHSALNGCNQNAGFSDNWESGENWIPQMALSKITAYGRGQMPQLAVCGVFLILDNSENYIDFNF